MSDDSAIEPDAATDPGAYDTSAAATAGEEPPIAFPDELPTDLPTGSGLDALLEALHVAVRLEEEGLQFYTLNAHRVRNPRGRAAFHILIRDEQRHLQKLRTQLDALLEGLRGTPDQERGERAPDREATSNPIFSRGRPLSDCDADERQVLREGIAIEWDAFNFYRERGEAARDPWSKLIYGDLALDERRHYETLVEAYETLLRSRR